MRKTMRRIAGFGPALKTKLGPDDSKAGSLGAMTVAFGTAAVNGTAGCGLLGNPATVAAGIGTCQASAPR